MGLIFSCDGEICKTIKTILVLMSLLLIFSNCESIEASLVPFLGISRK